MNGGTNLGKALYGALFTLAWPAALVALALRLDRSGWATWPVPLPGWSRWLLLSAGLALMIAAMLSLVRDGGGLPMNAYPTTRRVTGSVYALLAHPIYAGFSLAVAGAAVAAGSPAAFWVALPLSVLASAALVAGYEGPALVERLGPTPAAPILGLPCGDEEGGALHRRAFVGAATLGLWAALYALFSAVPAPSGAATLAFAWERELPRPPAAVWVYTLAYPFTIAAPLVLRTDRDLLQFARTAWLVIGLGYAAMLVLPGLHPFEMHAHTGLTARLMNMNEAVDAPWLACPSFHVAWAYVAAACFSLRWPHLSPLWWGAAAAVAVSCLLTGAHALVDLPAGWALGMVCWRHAAIWAGLVRWAERLGNSLHTWRLGPVRILSHVVWSFLAASVGTLVVLALAGAGEGPKAVVLVLAGLVGAGVWGAVLEGGQRLARPFGYFGFLIGSGACLLALYVADPAAAVLMAAFAVGAAPAQAIGRLRCVVQGCCHGRPTTRAAGMRITHPLSRVTQLSTFACTPIHPTPLYSAVFNLALFVLLLRLWHTGAPTTFIAGAYLALSSLARFVEERFRGEPQTPVHAGLTVYQWVCLGTFVAGLLVAMLPGGSAPGPVAFSAPVVLYALAAGTIVPLAMSVDFPDSQRPLSRLTVLSRAQDRRPATDATPAASGTTGRGTAPAP